MSTIVLTRSVSPSIGAEKALNMAARVWFIVAVAGAWLAARGYQPTVVVERLDSPELLDWFAGVRETLGMLERALDQADLLPALDGLLERARR